ncbi:BZ3500_MvSof-1268-A1-R1_Chr1-1g01127 [Microbotryum saponariae]|uniref:BZ3500_MvSof-1268-A1-R1_Chr1-1g01127 protein n=1 Tax=Microbotryum saponariae TaxID=289078 RepID=A0A2X0MC14_9BASI|nr:BZ3500_MvSof-1268-A1-R1_Chr1-1g01127 [Microbotryum saponariae]SCZ93444.1 BZ3501_MvSof-1269-A2-R1_Chr1-1g00724 [Microbotryum saponariae]
MTVPTFPLPGLAALIVFVLQCTQLAEAMPSGGLMPRRGTAFSALMTDRMKQCEPATIEFANSGNVRPLTVAIMLYDKAPAKLRTDKSLPPAKATLKTIQGLGPLQTFTVKKRDYDPLTFTAVAKRGDNIEVFAFFPNGTGQNMWLDRTIQTGSSSACLPVTCSSSQYLNPTNNKCASCSSLFTNSTSCTAVAPTSCSYGIVSGNKCVAKKCSAREYLGPKAASCISCPDPSARSCDANGKSTSCSVGSVVNGECESVICLNATYLASNGMSHALLAHLSTRSSTDQVAHVPIRLRTGRRCLPCPANATICDNDGQATQCSYGVPSQGKCLPIICSNGYQSAKANTCCADPFATNCTDPNTPTSCAWGYLLNTDQNGTHCEGPYASRFGNATYKYLSTASVSKTIEASNVLDCARSAHDQSIVFPWVYMWSQNAVAGVHCKLVPGGDPQLTTTTQGKGFDVGISGTCAQNADWSWSPAPSSCAKIWIGQANTANRV